MKHRKLVYLVQLFAHVYWILNIRGVVAGWLNGERQRMQMCENTLKPLIELALAISFGAEKSSPETQIYIGAVAAPTSAAAGISEFSRIVANSEWRPIFTYIDSYYTHKSSIDARSEHTRYVVKALVEKKQP